MADIKPVTAIGAPPRVAHHEMPLWARQTKEGIAAWKPPGAHKDATGGGAGQAGQEPPADKKASATPKSRAEKRPRVHSPTRPQVPQPQPTVDALAAATASAEAAAPSAPQIPEGALILTPEELEAHEQAFIDALREPYLAAAQRLEDAREELASRVHEDIVELAARLATALIHRAISEDRTITLEILQRAFRLAGPLEHVTVRCNADDADLIRERAPGLARAETGRAVEVVVRPSDDITAGGCVLTWEGGVVDARNERRLERIVEAVKTAIAENQSNKRQASETPPEADS